MTSPLAALRKLADEMRASYWGPERERASTLDSALRLLGEGKVAWDRCDACNGTLDDHYAPDGGGCPGFRKSVPADKPAEAIVRQIVRDVCELQPADDGHDTLRVRVGDLREICLAALEEANV
jgi:hypothetical protein